MLIRPNLVLFIVRKTVTSDQVLKQKLLIDSNGSLSPPASFCFELPPHCAQIARLG